MNMIKLLILLLLFGCIEESKEESSKLNTPKNTDTDTNSDNDTSPGQNDCPEGYAFIDGNSTYGTSDFCFMKIEARNNSNSPSATMYTTKPWHTIDGDSALAACRSLGYDNATGIGYDLITNPEWMTIAVDLESNPNNWTSSDPTNGNMYRGHTYASGVSTNNILAINVDANDLSQGFSEAHGSAVDRRRTLELTSGEVIWDMVGNLDEIVSWQIGNEFINGPTNCSAGHTDVMSFNCANFNSQDYSPSNPLNIAGYSSSTHALGTIWYSTLANSGSAIRGSYYGTSTSGLVRTGIFSLNMYWPVKNNGGFDTTGFRCVYRF